ncbi:DUF1513 domain-containing protein [Vibrio sp.]|uniref:DUF1513 domain-containing protein n=1 Tax=Vibrio sp. TaxID=678 RepID=UPI003D0FEB88
MVTDQTRRNLLKAALMGAAVPAMPFGCASVFNDKNAAPALIGCSVSGRDRYRAVVADALGQPLHTIALPGRGHGVAIHPSRRQAVAFARRPGQFMLAFDYASGEVIQLNLASEKRHYYGHGVFSNDGRWLFATEGERATSRGIIGVYDAQHSYQKVDELTGFGIGPHEVIVMQDDTLVIGVGGVHTKGRTALNIDSMQPSLSYLSPTGQLLDQARLADHHLSIRHLAHDGAETVLCGQQYRGEPDAYPALLAMHKRGGEIQPLLAEEEQWARFNHYIASIAATEDWILATSPRGNCYGIWSKQTRQLVELAALADASGVVVRRGRFQVSSGAGQVVDLSGPNAPIITASPVMWDNHWNAV